MLFDRTTRAVTLTDAGRAYLEDVREALAVLERAGERARATRPAVAVRIAYTASTAYKVLPLLVDALAATRAGVEVVALPRPAAAACEDLVRGDADLALVRDFTGAPRLVGEVVRREPVAVFMAADHPLAARAALRLDDLRGRTIAVVPAALSPGLHDLPGALCATRGFSPALEEFPGLADRSCCSRTSPAGPTWCSSDPRDRHRRMGGRGGGAGRRPGRHQRGERGVAR